MFLTAMFQLGDHYVFLALQCSDLSQRSATRGNDLIGSQNACCEIGFTKMAWRECERILRGLETPAKLIVVGFFFLVFGGTWWRTDPQSEAAEFLATIGALSLMAGLVLYVATVIKRKRLSLFDLFNI